jgi:glycosyltransferase involved in cell wall biosynthesis
VTVTEQPFGERGEATLARRAMIMLRLWATVLRTPAAAYHCHNIHPAPAVLIAARLRGARVIYDAHELYGEPEAGAGPLSRLVSRVARLAERVISRSADAVITTNPSRAEVLAERHRLGDVRVVGNLPGRAEEVTPIDPGFPEGDVLLYQGGLYAEARAFEKTIAALRHLPGVSFAMVGFGRDRDRRLIADWARESGVADRVHLFEAVPFDRLVGIAAAATVGVVPLRNISLNSYLGDTNKLFEYLMAGLPAVGSDFPEVARVLRSGEPPVGEVFDPEDEHSIAEAIRTVLGGSYADRRAEARRLALERFCWEHEEPELLRCYEDA